MAHKTEWDIGDSMEAYIDDLVTVGSLFDERRYGLFAIPEKTFREMDELSLASLFTRVVPIEMRPMQYELEDGSEVSILECMGVSRLFRTIEVEEKPPYYELETFNLGGNSGTNV